MLSPYDWPAVIKCTRCTLHTLRSLSEHYFATNFSLAVCKVAKRHFGAETIFRNVLQCPAMSTKVAFIVLLEIINISCIFRKGGCGVGEGTGDKDRESKLNFKLVLRLPNNSSMLRS